MEYYKIPRQTKLCLFNVDDNNYNKLQLLIIQYALKAVNTHQINIGNQPDYTQLHFQYHVCMQPS